MKVAELSKELGVTNKELIDFYKNNKQNVSSHSQNLTNEQVDFARDHFVQAPKPEVKEDKVEPEPVKKATKKTVPPKQMKVFDLNERIRCESLVPWRMEMEGVDKVTTYKWPGYRDYEYVAYKDLQAWRRKDIITKGKLFIDDPDICEQWKNDLGEMYKNFNGINYPEEFFDKPDDEFRKMLINSNDTFKEIIKYTAYDMIRNENYPSIYKVKIIDEVLNTGISDFIS